MSEGAALLSVIVPARNEVEAIGDQVRALIAQHWEGEWEIVIVDHRSTDGTGQLVRELTENAPNARVIRVDEGNNASFARNRGAEAAYGDLIVFCDGDDVVHPGWLAAIGRALEKHDLVMGRIESESLNPALEYRAEMANDALPVFFGAPLLLGGNTGMARWVFESVGGYDESLDGAEDLDFGLRVFFELGVRPHFVPDALISYRFRSDLKSIWAQARDFGEWQPALMKRHAHRLPRPPRRWNLAASRLLLLLRRVWKVGSRGGRQRAMFSVAITYGRIKGSIRHRYIYL